MRRNDSSRRSALADFSLRALSETNVHELLRGAVEAAAGELRADFASAFELTPDRARLLLVHANGWEPEQQPLEIALDSPVPAAEAIRTGRPFFVRRGSTSDFASSALRKHRSLSSAAVAVASGGEPLGVLAVHCRRAGSLAPDDLPFLESLANVAAAAIARERAVAEARGLATIVESCEDAIYSRTLDGRALTWNAAAERLLGWTADEVVGRPLERLVPPERVGEMHELSDRLLRGEVIREAETVRVHRDGSRVDVSATLSPIRDERGRIASVSVVMRPIGEQKRAGERLVFLASVGEILGGSLDVEQMLSGVAEVCVPRLSDWCIAYLFDEAGELRRVAVAHGDPGRAELAAALGRAGTISPHGDHPFARALRTREPQLYEVTEDDVVEAAAGNAELVDLYRQLTPQSALLVPLVARGRVAGAIAFIAEGTSHRWDHEDRQLAEEVARRAALAVDNARLYTEARRELARREATEETLRRSEERYRLLFERNPNPMWFFDTETMRILAVNEAAMRAYGYSREEFLGMRTLDLRPAADVEAHLDRVRQSTGKDGVSFAGVSRHCRKDGSLMDMAIVAQAVEYEGRPAQVVLAIDQTEQQAAERALRQSELRYRELLENASELIATTDTDWRLTRVNAAFAKAVGAPAETLLGRSLLELVPPEQRAELAGTRTALADGDGVLTHEHDLLTADGRRIAVEAAIRLLVEGGRPVGIHTICRDVTGRKEAERALRAAEERYRLLVERLPLVTFTHAPTPDATPTYVSPQIDALLGFPPEAWIGNRELFVSRLHPDDRERVLGQTHVETTRLAEFRLLARDGREVWILSRRHLVRDENGEPEYVLGFWLDITEKKRAEEALRESQELYRLVVENAPDLITITGPDGRFVVASPSHEAILGFTPEEIVGRHPREFRHPDDVGTITTALSDPVAAADGVSVAHRLRHKDGGWVEVEGSAVPVFDADGALRLVLATGRDISDRRRAEELAEQLRHAQKMEAIGRLAGGIAHDFNNLLTVITGYSDLARHRTDPETVLEAIDQIAAAAKTASALTGRLLAFSRQQVVQPRVLDVGDAIRASEGLLDRLIGDDVLLELDVRSGLGCVLADPTQVEQVLLNLAANAREAMPEGGLLRISARTVVVPEAGAADLPGVAPGRFVVVTVADTGAGMDEATTARIFEPFFTTKEDGTGLGLATVDGIVSQSGGRVLVESEPGRGTTFRLVFPAAELAALDLPVDDRPAPESGGSQTVLIVEDEELVRRLAEEILSGRGYTVLAAGSAEEALRVATDWKQPLDLVLSDVMLPGKRGPRLVEEVHAIHPEAKTIYTSGYAQALIAERGVRSEHPFLAKPFTASDLAAKVREVLAA